MKERAPIRVELLSNPVWLCGARELVASVATRLGFDEETCSQIKLAVDEALCNIIRHGYDSEPDRPIWLTIWPVGDEGSPAGMRLVIEDEARHVEPDQIRGRALEEIRPGGLGVHIIREVMDEVIFEKREPIGMRLILIKKHPECCPGDPTHG